MTLRWMLDTNTCVEIMRERKPPGSSGSLYQSLLQHPIEAVGISAIVHYELQYGVEKSQQRKRNQRRLDDFCHYVQTVPWTTACALEAARIRADLERNGTPIGPYDLLTAAHARSLGAAIVTHNTREFRRVVGLDVADWSVA